MFLAKRLISFVLWLFLCGFWLWSIGALYFFGLPGKNTPIIVSGLFAVIVPLAFIALPNRKRTAYVVLTFCIVILIGWTRIEPSHDRIWEENVARLPYVTIEGNQVRVHNVRNFDYKTEKEFAVDYYDKTYDLDQLNSVDYVLSYWDGNEAIAHTILSFDFSNGDHLAVSVETRLEKGESQDNLNGFFKQYELIYILADERDILRLRTNFRKEEVFLYPTTIPKEYVRKMFDIVVDRVNGIARQPEFYNALTENCFTSLARDFSKISPSKNPFDYRRLANGYSDEMLYENGRIDNTLNFVETKRLHHINQYVQDIPDSQDYSSLVRP